jgi:predicted Zn-dependent protease
MTTNAIIANLEKLLDGPRDGPLLRYSLGNEYLKAGEPDAAAAYLRQAVERDPRQSAAWKLLGKALTEAGDTAAAMAAYREGIAVAEGRGDIQAAREMKVFLKRLEKATSGAA